MLPVEHMKEFCCLTLNIVICWVSWDGETMDCFSFFLIYSDCYSVLLFLILFLPVVIQCCFDEKNMLLESCSPIREFLKQFKINYKKKYSLNCGTKIFDISKVICNSICYCIKILFIQYIWNSIFYPIII